MIEKVVKRLSLKSTSPSDDLAYWLSRPPEERLAAVEFLRRQHYGDPPPRLQRTVRIVQRTPTSRTRPSS